MTKKVLLWLDGPYGYLHYGIAKKLSSLDAYSFFGFVSYERDLEFYKTQNSINFEELHYYPKYYIENSKKPDMEYLHRMEDELKLNFWLIASAERTFLQERNFFHIFSSDEILLILESLTKFFYDFLNRVKPDFILMQKTGENLSNFLLYNIAKSMNIKTLMMVETRLENSFIISDDLLITNLKNDFEKIKSSSCTTKKYDPEFIQSKSLSRTVESFMSAEFGKSTTEQKISRYLKRLTTDLEPIYYNWGKTKSKMLKWRLHVSAEFRNRENFLKQYAINHVPNQKFVYFPLPVQPESQSNAWAPFHVNTFSIIENIAKSIPITHLLYVKEHPGQKAKLWRSVDFYEKIIALPNVRLIQPHVNNFEIISKSDLVLLINSSSGLEALFYKKPVIVFGHVFYDVVSMVKKVEKIEELPELIKNALFSFTFSDKELSFLMDAIEKNDVVVPYWEIMKEFVILSSILSHGDTNKAFTKFENLFKKYDDSFSILASAYHTIS